MSYALVKSFQINVIYLYQILHYSAIELLEEMLSRDTYGADK